MLVCLAILLLSAGLAYAQSPLGIGTAEPSIPTTGLFGGLFAWVNAQQQAFYRTLTTALKAMRENPWHLWSLVGLSFTYGVLHAAGPGHGKAVISAYMIANETELKRGVLLSFLSSFLQGLVAILLVGATFLVLRGTSITMTEATHGLEVTSYGLIALFGAWLLARKLLALRRPLPVAVPVMALAGHGHGAHVSHAPVLKGFAAHGHDHGHSHAHGEVCEACGHAHLPDPSLLKGEKLGLGDAWSAIVAVGLRPCSGALIVMSFALLNGLLIGGILSVFAMALGTAITVSVLATLAVMAKGVALRYAANGSSAARITSGIEIAGALFVMVLGLILFAAALQA